MKYIVQLFVLLAIVFGWLVSLTVASDYITAANTEEVLVGFAGLGLSTFVAVSMCYALLKWR